MARVIPGREIEALAGAIRRLHEELPGWWWRIGECSVSADATVGPDRSGPDADLLEIAEFDAGFDGDLRQPSCAATALHRAIDLAVAARTRVAAKTPTQD